MKFYITIYCLTVYSDFLNMSIKSLSHLSFVEVFEQFNTFTQFNILTELMLKMDKKDDDIIRKFSEEINNTHNDWDIKYIDFEMCTESRNNYGMGSRSIINCGKTYQLYIYSSPINNKMGVLDKNNDGFIGNLYAMMTRIKVQIIGKKKILNVLKMNENKVTKYYQSFFND